MQRVKKQVGLDREKINYDGSGIGIAVLDTGIGLHPDFDKRIYCFRDFVNHEKLPYDDSGHGTHVCGILCGSGRLSAFRYAGMAPGAGLVVGKVLNSEGDGATEDMLQGMDWILQEKDKYNIRILNISVGIGNLNNSVKEELLIKKMEEINKAGIMIVCAAGNKGPGNNSISSIGGNSGVITVGCHDGGFYADNQNRCELYSGRGDEHGRTIKPDLVAPGTNIISCDVKCKRTKNGYRNKYISKSGTSMATPIVSGAMALLIQKYPDFTNETYRIRLLFSSTDLGIAWNRQGWGMLNVERLLR